MRLKRALFWLLLVIGITSSHAQWQPLAYTSIFPDLNALDFRSSSFGLGAAKESAIIRTIDGGRSWDTVYNAPPVYTFNDLLFIDEFRVIAIGSLADNPGCNPVSEQSILIYSEDAGASWTTKFFEYRLWQISFPTPQTGYISASCGQYLKSTNGGENWAFNDLSQTTEDLYTISFVSDDIGYATNDQNELFKTTNGGTDWIVIPPDGPYQSPVDLQFVSEEVGYAVRLSNGIITTTDGGENWTIIPAVSAENLYVTDISSGYAGRVDGGLLQFIDGGATILPAPINTITGINDMSTRAIAFISPGRGFIAGSNVFYVLTNPKHTLAGTIYVDENEDCSYAPASEAGLNDWSILATNQNTGERNFTTSNTDGSYSLNVDTGQYTLTLFPPNENWLPCNTPLDLDLTVAEDTTFLNLGQQKIVECPVLEVDLSATAQKVCETNIIHGVYRNRGTGLAVSPVLEVQLDPAMSYITSSLLFTNVADNLFTADLPDIPPGAEVTFTIETSLSCDAAIGQTHCIMAHIRPDDFCFPPDPSWDGASLQVTAECEADSLIFTVSNSGNALAEVSNYIIIEDNVLLRESILNPGPGEDTTLIFYPEGEMLRMELDQSPFHPGRSQPSAAYEGCGATNSNEISLGFFTQYPEDDANRFVSMDCQENLTQDASLDLVYAYPKGYSDLHFIRPNQDIEYRIPFKNNGTTLVPSVYIQITPSDAQIITSTVAGAGSHPYDFFLSEGDLINFKLENIDLPSGAEGFIKFRIQQKPDNPDGTTISPLITISYGEAQPSVSGVYTHRVKNDFLPALEQLVINGLVSDLNEQAVEGVAVSLNGELENVTDAAGAYTLIATASEAPFILRASRSSALLNGLSAYDLYLLDDYLANPQNVNQPMYWLAADVDRSGEVNATDQVLLEAILLEGANNIEELPWRIIPKNTSLETININNSTVSESLELANPAQMNTINFQAIKTGDLNSNAQANTFNPPDTANLDQLVFQIEDMTLEAGTRYKIPLTCSQTVDIRTWQAALRFDPSLVELLNMTAGDSEVLPAYAQPETGLLTIAWYEPAQLIADSAVIYLELRALSDTRSSEIFELDHDFLWPEAYLPQGSTDIPYRVTLESKSKIDYAGLLATPNPARDDITIRYRFEQHLSEITLSLYNAQGQQLWVDKHKEYNAGQEIQYQLDTNQWANGTYFLVLNYEDTTITERLIFSN